MKLHLTSISFLIFHLAALAGEMPLVTDHPQSQIAHPGTNVSFSVVSPNASYFQWRFNDVVIQGATNAVLQITNVQVVDSGYYLAFAINADAWVPSDMAYLSVVDSNNPGSIPLSNMGGSQALSQVDFQPINNGTAWALAGPELDQMQRVGPSTTVANGYFNASPRTVPLVSAGQTVFYRVEIVYPFSSGTYTQKSTVTKLVAAPISPPPFPPPVFPPVDVYFPVYIEWPEPQLVFGSTLLGNLIRFPGETIRFTMSIWLIGNPMIL